MGAQRRPFPGEAEANAEIEAARRREADLALRIQRSERDREEAMEVRAALSGRLTAGEDVSGAELGAATSAVAAAEERTAILQDALREAEAATKGAEARLASAMVAELRRRAAPARAASQAALAHFLEAQTEHGRLDVLASELLRARGRNLQELEYQLTRSAEFGAAAAGALK